MARAGRLLTGPDPSMIIVSAVHAGANPDVSNDALLLIALAGVFGIPLITAVLFVTMMWLLRRFGVKVK